jgi:hypothetical protein
VSATKRQAGPAFRPDEFLETLLRIKRDQPRRYARGQRWPAAPRRALRRTEDAGRRDREGKGSMKTLVEQLRE